MENTKEVLASIASADLPGLMAIWRSHQPENWSASPDVYRVIGENLLKLGEPLLAYDVIREGLGVWSQDLRLRQLQGLALARSGATERANSVLEKLRTEGRTDEETLGMLGRTLKDLALSAASEADQQHLFRRAAEIYAQAYQATSGYWTGINAATMNLLIGEKDLACEIANRVRDQCLIEVQDPGGDSYWELAALGEAALICRDWSQAEEWYARAAENGKNRFGDLHSSRRNARLILQHWNEDQSWLDKYLRVPSVIVFAGHMIDRPDRSEPRFPNELQNAVANEIHNKIHELKPGFGFASAACGSDILFLEEMLHADAEVSIVLPYGEEEFVRDSVDIIPDSNWRTRFERILSRAAHVITASTERLEIGGVSYEFCNQLLLGLATIRCRQLDSTLVPLAVWNGKTGDGPGGAASVVENWQRFGYEPEIIDLAKLLDGRVPSWPKVGADSLPPGVSVQSADAARSKVAPQSDEERFNSRIVSVLFADAVGFSKLTEPEVPRFVQHFLGAIADLSDEFGESILAKNTWGDGLYFVFSDVDLAGNFALQLADLVTQQNWGKKACRED